jgi:hypothetical protein
MVTRKQANGSVGGTVAEMNDCGVDDVQKPGNFRRRMEAQCCQIERYRAEVLYSEGRFLSQNEAALEWIERYAPAFEYSDNCTGV